MDNFNYVVFMLGYDLIHDGLVHDDFKTDEAFDKCRELARQFMSSDFNRNTKGLYECVQDFLKNKEMI